MLTRRLDRTTRMRPILVLTLAAIAAAPISAADLPEPLRRFIEERQKAVTGIVEWSETTADRVYRGRPGRTRFLAARFGGDTVASENRGDEDGVVVPSVDGYVGPSNRRKRSSLIVDGQIWSTESLPGEASLFVDGEIVPDIRAIPSPPLDPRGVGIFASGGGVPIHGEIWTRFDDFVDARFEERRDGELRVVRATASTGVATEWWIDPAKGWSIVRVTSSSPAGDVRDESRLTIEEFDGVWLPSEVQTFSARYENGTVATKTLQLHSAEINRPDQPARLTPADIGIVPGTSVMPMNAPREERRSLIWSGRSLVESRWWARTPQEDAELEAGYAAAAEANAAVAAAAALARSADDATASEDPVPADRGPSRERESDWQRYTREFIAKHKLNNQQSRRAWTICERCESDRDKYLKAHQDEFAQLVEAVLMPDETAAAAPDQSKRLAERRAQLEAPINAIFEEQLKPRLDKLPIRAQRERAERATAASSESETPGSP